MEIQKDNKGLGTIIKIHGFKDLTPAELKLLQQKFGIVGVRLVVPNRLEDEIEYYTPRTYCRLYNRILELVDGIGDDLPDPLKFLFIYRRLNRNITYDFSAAEITDKNNPRFRNCRNLIGPLLEGKAVCEGYAMALKVASDFKDVPCKYIFGRASNTYHSWNIAKLDEKWIGADCTWDMGGGMDNCAINSITFNNEHDYSSISDFVRGDNQLVFCSIDWSKYLNDYLHIKSDCKYKAVELEHFYDLLEDALTKGEDINVLKEEVEARILMHNRVKSFFDSANIDYKQFSEKVEVDELELYDWIIDKYNSHRTSRSLIEDYEKYKKEQNENQKKKDAEMFKLIQYKSNKVAEWARNRNVDFRIIEELEMDLDELYDIVFPQRRFQKIEGVKRLRINLVISKKIINRFRLKRKIKKYGGNYHKLHAIGITDEEILKASEGEFYEYMFLATRAYNSENNIKNAEATIGQPYSELRAIGLTDFILAEIGKKGCSRNAILSLLQYKTGLRDDRSLCDPILEEIERYKNRKRTDRKNEEANER